MNSVLKVRMFNKNSFRVRKIPYPRTYVVLKKQKDFYLLCWLEYGKDGSLYVWLDDNPNNGWEVIATHNQTDIVGKEDVSFGVKKLQVFDPHLSWHSSGRVHVSGYDKDGKKGEHLISDRKSDSLKDLKSGFTAPFTQIVFPNLDGDSFLKYIGTNLEKSFKKDNCVCFVTSEGLRVLNNNSQGEAFLIINRKDIPIGIGLAIDIGVYYKKNNPQFIGASKTRKSLLFPEIISSYKESSVIAAAIRLLKVEVIGNAKRANSAVATCFNRESVDLFLFKRK